MFCGGLVEENCLLSHKHNILGMTMRVYVMDVSCSNSEKRPISIRFYNTLWLIANDIIIGIAVGSFLMENCDSIASTIDSALSVMSTIIVFMKIVFMAKFPSMEQNMTVSSLRSTIVWLMGWPAGLKLNSELNSFLGELFLWLVHVWSGKVPQHSD